MKTNIRVRSFSLLASLALAITAFLSSPALGNQVGGGALDLTPFTRVAVIGPIADPVEADAQAKAVATAIATYVATVNDHDIHDFPADWILGGLEGTPTPETIQEAILHIPTPYKIDPDDPMSAENRKKVNLVEMCNPMFAKKALGVLPIVEDDPTSKVINGYIHAPALPCEVAIYAEDGNVYVEMLNPEAIFTLFFTDVLFGEQMQDPDFAAEIQALPAQVNYEIKTIIYAALDSEAIDYDRADEPLGPEYKSLEQVAQVVAETPYQSPFVHFAYRKSNGDDFTAGEVDEVGFIVDKIIETFSLDGIHPVSLDKRLNMDDWRSARPHPLPVPGNLVIEACSPTNAITAMGLGMDHATALPCEIAVKAVSYDGVDGNETLLISYLDPHFMFSALFSDAFGGLEDEDMEAFMALPPLVLEDLQTIVKEALKRKNLKEIDIKLKKPQQLFFDMLPDDDDDDDDDDHKKKHHKRHHNDHDDD